MICRIQIVWEATNCFPHRTHYFLAVKASTLEVCQCVDPCAQIVWGVAGQLMLVWNRK